jgi:hypothetical protein
VKARLFELFNGKCAYCESYYAATQPVDVEHWRPKAAVTPEVTEETQSEPGYWRLASDWECLPPSCIDCNRAREQVDIADRGRRLLGKANRFPVEPGTKRARNREELKGERPLLLNPCVDDPQTAITISADDPSIVVPVAKHPRGEASISVYGLNRSGLVVARRERLFKIRLHMYAIVRLTRLLEASEDPRWTSNLNELIVSELRSLVKYRRTTEPFSMMARHVIEEFLRQHFGSADVC